jgi:hypothetical protein
MNIKESIRRILSEETQIPSVIRRRVSSDDIEEAFEFALEQNADFMNNPRSIIFKEKEHTTLRVFSKFVIDDMVTHIEQESFNDDNRIYFSDNEEDTEKYHEQIRKPLLKHYGKRIKERYNEVKSDNINEGVDKTTSRRLLYIADEYLEDNLNPKDVCDYLVTDDATLYVNETIGEITRYITDKIFDVRNYGLDYSEEWGKIYDVIYNLLRELNYDGKVREFFYDAISNCE